MKTQPGPQSNSQLIGLLIGLGILILGLTVSITCVVTMAVIQQTVDDSEVYRAAAGRVSSSQEVKLALGEPVVVGPPENIIVYINLPDMGWAVFTIPVSGSQADGRAHITAHRRGDGPWEFERLTVTADNQPAPVDLLNAP